MRRPGLFSRSFFRSPGRPVAVLFGLGCLLAPRLSAAHIMLAPPPATPFDWLKPNSEGDPQKITPCGVDATTAYTPSNKINVVTVGDKLTINWIETVPHDGHFRIALAASRADLTDPATVSNGDGTAKTATISTAYPILADGLFEHLASSVSAGKTYSYTITIPNMPCAKCTLQLLQFMANHPLDPSYFYHHCADMMILAAPTGAGGTTGGGAGASGSAGTGGGAGVSGGAGTSGDAGSNGAGGVTGSGTAGTGVASGTAGVTGSGTAGVTGSGTGGVTGSGTAGVTGSGTAGVTGSGTAGVTGSGTAGTGVASGTGGSSGGTGTVPTSGCGCQTAGRTAGLGAFGLCAIALLVGRRARRARRR